MPTSNALAVRQRPRPVKALLPCLLGAVTLGWASAAWAQADAADNVPLFSQMATGAVPAPWHFAGLPRKHPTQFQIAALGGSHVLRLHTQDGYGNLVLTLQGTVTHSHHLQWRWRLKQPVACADLRRRDGDDAALKLCVSFDFDARQLSWSERTQLRLDRITTGEPIPTETLCYVWDTHLAPGTVLHSPFTHRLRYWVLGNATEWLGQWHTEQRDLASDYAQVFGDESPLGMPALTAVTVSADADNTHGEGLAYVGDIHLRP